MGKMRKHATKDTNISIHLLMNALGISFNFFSDTYHHLGIFAQNCRHWDPCTYNRGHNLGSSINIYLRQRYLRIAHGLIHSLLKTLICITLQAFNVAIHFYASLLKFVKLLWLSHNFIISSISFIVSIAWHF